MNLNTLAPSCGSCRHWKRLPRPEGSLEEMTVGECRHSPPHPVFAPVADLAGRARMQQVGLAFPLISATDPGCGQNAPRIDV